MTIFANSKENMENRILKLILGLKSKCTLSDEEIRSKTPLSPAEYNGLIQIERDDEYTATEFSAIMGVSVSRGSRVIEKMINNGYLKYRNSKEDRRKVYISIADEGLIIKKMINKMMEKCEKSITSKLTKEQLVNVEKTITLLIDAL